MLLLAAVSVALDPISSLDITARLFTDVACAGECRLVVGSLQYVDGEYATSARGSACGDVLRLEQVPFGAHLTPRVTFTCDGKLLSETGPSIVIGPYLTNVVASDDTIWVPALAEPRGDERIRLRVTGDAGFDVTGDFSSRDLVLRKLSVPYGRLQLRASLEPYGIVSNTRTIVREEPDDHWVGTQVGCHSGHSGMGVLALLFFRRRRFPFPRGFC